MIQPYLDSIAAHIQEYNPYFDKYFTNVEQSDTTGIVHNSFEPVFPNDIYGNFFYLRLPSKMGVVYNNSMNNADRSVGISIPLHIVASVKNADPYKLAGNIISTVGRMCDITKKFTSILVHNEDVIMQELGKCDEHVIESALQRQPNDALISVNCTIEILFPFTQLNCIQNPCLSC